MERPLLPLLCTSSRCNNVTASLKDRVHNVATNGSTRTEDGRISQLLSKLLAHLPTLALLTIRTGLLRHRHGRHVGVVRARLRLLLLRLGGLVPAVRGLLRGGGVAVVAGLLGGVAAVGGAAAAAVAAAVLGHGLDVGLGEDALLAGALVAAHPPVRVHVLVDGDLVVPLEGAVTGVRGLVGVEGPGVGDDGLGRRRGRGLRVVAAREGRGLVARGLGVGGGLGGVGVVVVEAQSSQVGGRCGW